MNNSMSNVYREMHDGVDFDVAARVSATLRRAYGCQRDASKRLARATDSDPRAVKAWLYGQNAPSLSKAIDLAAECDELAELLNQMIAERRAICGR